MTTSYYEVCQNCILADAGAIHLEEVEKLNGGKYKVRHL